MRFELDGDITKEQIDNLKIGSVIYDHGFSREMMIYEIIDNNIEPYIKEVWVFYMSHKGYSRICVIRGYDEFLRDNRFSLILD